MMIPFPDNPNTDGRDESVREVLAVTLDPTLDRDGNGCMDADNDCDTAVDEDLPTDATKDDKPGIIGIDDDYDGLVDELSSEPRDDDEDDTVTDDWIDGIDNDGDGAIDEDANYDMNNDGKSGIKKVDDDGDGEIDEGPIGNDDEDLLTDEDWLDPVVYSWDPNSQTLVERQPNLDPTDGGEFNDQYVIAENVTGFRVTRQLRETGDRAELVEITLKLGDPNATGISLRSLVRVGGGSR